MRVLSPRAELIAERDALRDMLYRVLHTGARPEVVKEAKQLIGYTLFAKEGQ